MSRLLPPRHAALLLALALLTLLPGSGSLPLVDPDEGRHAQIARELLEASTVAERVVPRLEGARYHDKPILFYWVVAGAYAALGTTAQAARVPSLLAGIGTVLLTAGAATRWCGAPVGLLAGLVMLSAPEVLLLGRAATLDMLLTLWTTLGVLAGWRWLARGSSAALVVAAVAAALGTLTKGLVAPVLIFGTVASWMLLERRRVRVRPLAAAAALAAYAAVVGPWLAAAWLVDPAYLRELLLLHHVQRFVGGGPARLHAASALTYVPVLLVGFYPWSLLLPASVAGVLRRGHARRAERFCAVWAALVLVFFSLSRGKLGTYILPAFPPLAILTAAAVARLVRAPGSAPAPGGRMAQGGLVAAGLVAAAVPAVALPLASVHYGGALLRPAFWTLLLLPVGLATAACAARGRLRGALVLAGGMVSVASIAVPLVAGDAIGELTGTAHLVAIVREEAPDADVVVYGLALPSLRFGLGRPVTHLDRPRALARFVAAHPQAAVVTTPRHAATVAAAAPLVVRHLGPRRVLFLSAAAPAGGRGQRGAAEL